MKTIDERELGSFERALRELGYDPADFQVRISGLAPDPEARHSAVAGTSQRKEIVVTRLSTGDMFRQEAYVTNAWAGEVMQALVSGLLGPRP